MHTNRVGLVTVAALSFIVGLEMTVRIEERIRYDTPLFAPDPSQADLIVTDSLGTHGRPGGRFRNWALDSLGFRGPEVSRRPPPGVIRIAVSGASESFGQSESPGQEYPRQLEDSLNAQLAQSLPDCSRHLRFQVINAALPGMYLPTALTDIRGRLATMRPAAVLYYPSPSQYLDIAPPRAYTGAAGGTTEASALMRLYPRSFARIRETFKTLLPSPVASMLRQREIARVVRSHPPGWRFTEVPEDRLRAFDSDIRTLVGAIRGIGAIPILATHANVFGPPPGRPNDQLLLMWQRFSPRATGATLIAFELAANSVLRHVAADSAAVLVRADSALSDPGVGSHFSDYEHFTDTGAAVIANTATDAILAHLTGNGGTCPAGYTETGSAEPRAPALTTTP